jgi:hypothetical protein
MSTSMQHILCQIFVYLYVYIPSYFKDKILFHAEVFGSIPIPPLWRKRTIITASCNVVPCNMHDCDAATTWGTCSVRT